MSRSAIAFCASLLAVASASAATLTVTPDKSVYQLGETITLSVVGDSQGGVAAVVQGFLRFDPFRARGVSISQQPLTSLNGLDTWGLVFTGCIGSSGQNGCVVFDQIGAQPQHPLPVDNLLLSTFRLTALAPGVLDFTWETRASTGLEIIFFGLTNAPGTSITIVPEPGSAALLGAGLLALAASRRRTRA